MPTASPSMMPSTGVTLDMSSTPDSDSAASTAMPTPTRAVTMGSAAAMTVPSMTSSTTAAIARPAISPTPIRFGTDWARVDEKAYSTPSIGFAST